MASLRDTPVWIIVHKPNALGLGNIFGSVINDRGKEKIIVKLNDAIKGFKIESDLLELIPINPKETFKGLTQYYSLMINGILIREDETEFVLTGTVTID